MTATVYEIGSAAPCDGVEQCALIHRHDGAKMHGRIHHLVEAGRAALANGKVSIIGRTPVSVLKRSASSIDVLPAAGDDEAAADQSLHQDLQRVARSNRRQPCGRCGAMPGIGLDASLALGAVQNSTVAPPRALQLRGAVAIGGIDIELCAQLYGPAPLSPCRATAPTARQPSRAAYWIAKWPSPPIPWIATRSPGLARHRSSSAEKVGAAGAKQQRDLAGTGAVGDHRPTPRRRRSCIRA